MKHVHRTNLQRLRIGYLVLVGLVLPALALAQGFFRVAPGPLNEGHAAYDNSDGCSKCHESGQGVTNGKCLSCHNTMMHAGGLHVTFGNKPCIKCHVEHKGRAFSIIDWSTVGGRDTFKHSVTAFSLAEHHSQVGCPKCHVKRLKTGRTSHIGLSPQCRSCHTDAHHFRRQELNENCNICHQPGQSLHGLQLKSWSSQHAKFSKQQLDGRHQQQACVKCHEGAKMGERAVARQCADCHTPTHPITDQTRNCVGCHNQNSEFKGTRIDHAKFGFPLQGKHARSTCGSCHLTNSKKGPGRVPSKACSACHAPAHPVTKATANCVKCHGNVETFKGAHIDHSGFDLALHGKHEKLPCRKCHQPKVKLDYREGACTNCHNHRNAHDGQFKDKPCATCHVEGGKRTTPFNHDKDTRFPLVGAHNDLRVKNDCARCHPGKLYRTGKHDCTDCHEDKHNGLLGKTCDRCHSPRSKFQSPQTSDFKHKTFVLEGKHKTLACKDCHANQQYNSDRKTCYDCHQKDDKHSGRLGQDCGKCHRPEKGAPKFDHNTMTKFARTGAHQDAKCALCHQPKGNNARPLSVAEWRRVIVTNLDRTFPVRGNRCVDCHRDPHSGSYGTACETCHSTHDFKNAAAARLTGLRPADHKGFWLRRHAALADQDEELSRRQSSCAACHGSPGCENCHRRRAPRSHTALFRIRTHGAAAAFDPQACSTCHRAPSCNQCHRRTPPLNHRGAWRTLHGYAAGGFTDSNCFVCHRRAECALCHRPR
jgi:hypothetical protein